MSRVEQLFWGKVSFCDHLPFCPYCCWKWTATLHPAGYGVFTFYDVSSKLDVARGAHRFAWQVHNRRSLGALWCLHYCHVRSCVNPLHLYAGTCHQNTLDRLLRFGQISYEEYQHGQLFTRTDYWRFAQRLATLPTLRREELMSQFGISTDFLLGKSDFPIVS